MKESELIKYPRTPHIEGSRLQPGDEDLSQIPFKTIQGKYIVVEEKVDGANTAVSAAPDGELLLQSRGHYLCGGYREKHYNLLKQWANIHKDSLYRVLGSRYIMYGEWLYAKHSTKPSHNNTNAGEEIAALWRDIYDLAVGDALCLEKSARSL